MKTLRILVADDHALIREGLRKVFRREQGMEVVAEARDGAEAIAAARREALDVAILDVNMPGRGGLDALQAIRASRPGLPVLILSMMPEREVALRAFRAGASGFVSKESAAEEIVEAVRSVVAGRKYVSPKVGEELALGLGAPQGGEPHDALTDRERQVLRLIARGRGTRAVADELSLSVNTVATYRRRIYEKLGVRSDVEMARYALEHHLAD